MSGENPHPQNELLTSYLLGRLTIEEEDAVERHLDGCPTCATLAVEMQPVDELVQLVSASRVHERQNRKDSWNPAYTVADDRVSTSGSAAESGEIEHLSEPPRSETGSLPSELRKHPRYLVIRLLGRGGMGTVWLAEHLVLGRHVALKLLRSDWTDRSSKIARFRREIQASAKLSHPNIATVHDAEQVGDLHFLVMEYVEGETLAEIVSRGALPIEEACRVIRDAARGLAHAHATGLVHRDVKPGNLMRTPKGEVKVLDFGLVVSLEQSSSLTGPAIVMGTPDYISPEQAEDPHTADERSDIYSLGCTFYHLLAGRPPFEDTSILRRINAHRERLAPEIPGIPEEINAILRRMMNKSPGERYRQATEVAEALDPFCSSFAVDASEAMIYVAQRTVEGFQVAQVPPLITHVAEPVTSNNPATALQARGRSSGLNRRLSGLILGLLLLVTGVVYHIQTDRGELVIETKDDSVDVVVRKGGKIVMIIDTETQKRVRLKSGVYELELDGRSSGLNLDLREVELLRGKEVIATIRREPSSTPLENSGTEKPPENYAETTATKTIEQPVHRLESHPGLLRCVRFSPDSRFVYSGCDDGKVRSWEVATGRLVSQFNHCDSDGNSVRILGLAFIEEGKTLLTCQDNRVRIWRVADAMELPGQFELVNPDQLSGLDTSPDGSLVVAGSVSGRTRVWTIRDRKLKAEINGTSTNPAYSVSWIPGSSSVALDNGCDLNEINVETGEIMTFSQRGDGYIACTVSADGKLIVGIMWSGQILVIPRQTGAISGDLLSGHTRVRVLADGRLVTAGASDAAIWEIGSLQPQFLLRDTSHFAAPLAVSPDGQWIATGGSSDTVQLWRVPPAQEAD